VVLREVLLVDGYNIIHAWPELKEISKESLEEARHALIEIMQDFQGYKDYRIIVVFDAYMISGGLERKERFGQLEVVFTKENETNMPKREKVAEPIEASHGDQAQSKKPLVKGDKVGRNDPCPCGSGKKYKRCHGA
jgi:predicted RNA-binding protein with PIN domain